jgi:hypothetical protein
MTGSASLNGRVEKLERRIGEARPCPGAHGVIIYGPGQAIQDPSDVPACDCPGPRLRIFLPERRAWDVTD